MLNLIKSRFCRWHPLAENRWVTLSRAIKRKHFDSIGNRLSKFNWCIWLALHKNIFQACKICFRPLQLKSIISYQMIFPILSLELRLSKLYSKVFFPVRKISHCLSSGRIFARKITQSRHNLFQWGNHKIWFDLQLSQTDHIVNFWCPWSHYNGKMKCLSSDMWTDMIWTDTNEAYNQLQTKHSIR